MTPKLVFKANETDRKEPDKWQFKYLGPWTIKTLVAQSSVAFFFIFYGVWSFIFACFISWIIAEAILWNYANYKLETAYKYRFEPSLVAPNSRKSVTAFMLYCWPVALIYLGSREHRKNFFVPKLEGPMAQELRKAKIMLDGLSGLPDTEEVRTAKSQIKNTISDLEGVQEQIKCDEAGIIAYGLFKEAQLLSSSAQIALGVQKELMASYHQGQLDELKALGPEKVVPEVLSKDRYKR